MRNHKQFLVAIDTLLYAWGGDAPPEAIWALGDFVKWINQEYSLDLEAPNEEDYAKDSWEIKMGLIRKALQNSEINSDLPRPSETKPPMNAGL